MSFVLWDTHCHLDQFADAASVLEAASLQRVERIVAVSEDPTSMAAVLRLQCAFPDRVTAGLGLHPAWVTRSDPAQVEQALEWLDAHLDEAGLLAEIGLDHKWAETSSQRQYQSDVLERLLELAATHRKPVGLHSRRCLRQTMERAMEFRRRTGLQAQLHWFTQSVKLVRMCNTAGVFVSVGPTVIGHEPTQEN